MGWFTSGSACGGNKDWECTYEAWDYPYDQWCRDVSGSGCPSSDDAGGLIKEKKASGGNGGW